MKARGLAILAVLAGCQGNPINTPIRSFDRPSDVALMCGQFDPDPKVQVFKSLPLDKCNVDRTASYLPIVCNVYTFFGPTQVPSLAAFDPNTGLQNQSVPTLFAVVANSARGELALVDVDNAHLKDLDPEKPGFNFLPVGRQPEHVRTTHDGCRAVTANADSCDLSLVDTTTMLNMNFWPARARFQSQPNTDPQSCRNLFPSAGEGAPLPAGFGVNVVQRITPMVNGVALGARPSWIEIAPESVDGTSAAGQCMGGAYNAWVALPGCQLVVEVALTPFTDGTGKTFAPGEVLRAVQVTPSGAQLVADVSKLSCTQECSGPVPDGGTPSNLIDLDAGAGPSDGGVDGGALRPSTQSMPSAFTIECATNDCTDADKMTNPVARMVIGDSNGERLTIVPLDKATGVAGAPRSLALEAGASGVQTVRMSPRSTAGKFLYAVARDASVRVIDLDREVECETNPDPRWLNNPATGQQVPSDLIDPAPDARRLGCFPLGLASTPPRSPLATSPGIQLGGGALPKDIAFVHVNQPTFPADPSVEPAIAGPSVLMGDFAWIVGSDGRATPINIYDACLTPNSPQGGPGTAMGTYTPPCDPGNVLPTLAVLEPGRPIPLELDRISHRTRLGTNRFFPPNNNSDVTGAPRLQDETNPVALTVNGQPVTDIPDGGTSTEAVGFPRLVAQNLAAVNGTAMTPPAPLSVSNTRNIAFPDVDHVHNETWTVAWEGALPGTARGLGFVRTSSTDATVTFVDTGAAFCSHGVLAGDKLQLTGCNSDSDCDFSQTCQRDPLQPTEIVNGLCLDRLDSGPMLSDEVRACATLLRSERQYRIFSAKQNTHPTPDELTDVLTLREIYEPEHRLSDGLCASDADCANDGVVGSIDQSTAGGGVPPGALATRCLPDYDNVKRCYRPCTLDGTPGVGAGDMGVPDGGVLDGGQCGAGFVCAPSQVAGDLRCMRAPLDHALLKSCLREAVPYAILAGNAFVVSGSSSGFLADVQPDPATQECRVPVTSDRRQQEYVRLRQGRIRLDGAPCSPELRPYDVVSVINGTQEQLEASALNPLDVTQLDLTQPNYCKYADATRPQERIMRFENPFFVIGLELPTAHLVPPDLFALSFIVVGGSQPAVLALGVDIPASQPRSVVVTPDQQTFLVVDEGKSTTATGLRGQLLRVLSNPPGTDRFFIVR
ncbi:MAG TPA: hypothetical protein VFF06_36930 [Polyangia bacterium]|nr:hypothetical protein [Polyangia bacterium]